MQCSEIRKYYDNKEEHGLIIDWNKVWRIYKKVMRDCHAPSNLFDPTTAPVMDAKYFVYMSERATGKTTNWIIVGMILYVMYGIEIQYVRQTEDMIKPSIANDIFNVILTYANGNYIRAITNNKYCGIYIRWKKAYFCNFDDEHKPVDIDDLPFMQFLSVDQHMDYKSGYNAPTGDLILFDEFISNTYRVNEFVDFLDLCSTIIRKRKTPIIVMLSNTINYNSTYFKELEISREIKKLKVGQSRLIETEKGTRVYTELIGMKPSAIKTQVNRLFYGFKNPRLAAITGGEQTWSFDPVPHIVNSETDEIIDRRVRMDCGEVMLQLDLVETEDRGLIVNVHECTKIREDSIILTNGEIRDRQHIWGLGRGKYFKLIWTLYQRNLFYYDTNETGSLLENYIKTYRQIKK